MAVKLDTSDPMRGRRRRRRTRPVAEINVTPFVDVLLVLLLVFMVAAPLLIVGVDVVPSPIHILTSPTISPA